MRKIFQSKVFLVAIMSGARTQWNTNLSEKFFLRMKTIFPDLKDYHILASILLANTYFPTEKSDRLENLRKEIRESIIRPQVGRSWTCVNGQLVVSNKSSFKKIKLKRSDFLKEFRAHDRSHSQSEEIYQEIDLLAKELIQFGHKFDSRWITRPLDNDETIESVLSGHCERLAIAFNFIQKTIPSPIQITKNLRICGDCRKSTNVSISTL